MNRKILYIINPISGTKNKTTLQNYLNRSSSEAGLAFEIIQTSIDGDYEFLPGKVREEMITDVIVCGGDGSVSRIAGSLLGEDINIGIIPMGSGNGLALAARIPASARGALAVILRGNAAPIDGFMVNEKFSCMMCGMGSDAQVAHDFAAGTKRGLKTYLKISAGQFFRARPYSFTVELPGKQISSHAFFISIANSNQFGNHITIAPQASLSDGLLDIVVVNKMSKMLLPFQLLHQISGKNRLRQTHKEDKRNILYFQTDKVIVHNHDLAPLHIDGEPEPPTQKISIRIIPKAFRLLQPSV
ncbi:MAG TPA: diacylglycerol kinase family protein [Flavitalea sp.]|nr:diacylglycerol kinase family protein [Flavitalea sp.]